MQIEPTWLILPCFRIAVADADQGAHNAINAMAQQTGVCIQGE
jgi:hypothetical protein